MSLKDFISQRQTSKLSFFEDEKDQIAVNFDLLKEEYEQGAQLAESCMIPGLANHFSWKRGFQNCWTGFPNDGKTQFLLFVMVVKALRSGWKFVIWSPEMRSSTYVDGKVKVHYNDLILEIVAMVGGQTPHKHIAERYQMNRMSLDKVLEISKWVKKHFIFLDPCDKKPDYIHNRLCEIYDQQGFDGVLIDPFKNVEHDIRVRDDIYLDRLFDTFKDMAVRTNSSMNWIAHPKANVQRVKENREGALERLVCDQYMLNGGAAWDNGMDGIYSILRPGTLRDPSDPRVTFYNLKQRKQELTTDRGKVEGIVFDKQKRRYYFDEIDPFN